MLDHKIGDTVIIAKQSKNVVGIPVGSQVRIVDEIGIDLYEVSYKNDIFVYQGQSLLALDSVDPDDVARLFVLLKASYDILTKCKEAQGVIDPMSQTAVYDGTPCDGQCLLEDIEELIYND